MKCDVKRICDQSMTALLCLICHFFQLTLSVIQNDLVDHTKSAGWCTVAARDEREVVEQETNSAKRVWNDYRDGQELQDAVLLDVVIWLELSDANAIYKIVSYSREDSFKFLCLCIYYSTGISRLRKRGWSLYSWQWRIVCPDSKVKDQN